MQSASWTPGWEGLLDFDHPDKNVGRAKSEPGADATSNMPVLTPGKIASLGSDLAWRTILGSVVEVEGVGPVGVANVLQEIWKRGGGDAVSFLS